MIDPKTLESRIEKALSGAKAQVQSHDLVHYEANVTYEGFRHKTRLQMHRMVYQCLGDDMKTNIHAFKLKTQLPEE